MMTAAMVLFMGWVTLAVAGDTPIGGCMHRMLVAWPAAALNRLDPAHIALAIVVTALIVVHLTAGDADPIRMVALVAPEITLWLASVELGALVEAVVAVAAVASALRRAGLAAALTTLSPRLPRHRKNKTGRARNGPRPGRKAPANDDGDDAGLALAS